MLAGRMSYFRSRVTTTAKALSGYFDEEFNDADGGSELTEAQRSELMRSVARADRDEELHSADEAFAKARSEIYTNELVRRAKDAKEHPESTIPMKQAFAELRKDFGVAE